MLPIKKINIDCVMVVKPNFPILQLYSISIYLSLDFYCWKVKWSIRSCLQLILLFTLCIKYRRETCFNCYQKRNYCLKLQIVWCYQMVSKCAWMNLNLCFVTFFVVHVSPDKAHIRCKCDKNRGMMRTSKLLYSKTHSNFNFQRYNHKLKHLCIFIAKLFFWLLYIVLHSSHKISSWINRIPDKL